MDIEYILNLLPFKEETTIRILGYGGIACALLAIYLTFRAISLNTSLSLKKAHLLIQEKNIISAPEVKLSNMPELQLDRDLQEPEKPKRKFLDVILTAEAEEFLDKITIHAYREDGWLCMPSRSPIKKKEKVNCEETT